MNEYGVRDQVVRGAASFEEAYAAHQWRVPERYNIASDIVDRWADDPSTASRTALAVLNDDGSLTHTTWAELQRLSRRLGQALLDLGVSRGDVVGVVLGQGLANAVVQLATYRIGAVVCPISQLYGGEALTWRLRHSAARAVVGGRATVELVAAARETLPDLIAVIDADAEGSAGAGSIALAELLARDAECSTADTAPDDPAVLIYTSGTTGDPKGVLHGQRVALGHANVSYLYEDFRDDDILWSPNDWSWIAGIGNGLLAPLGFGVPIYSMGSGPFEPHAVAAFINAHRPTISFLPPAALRLLRQSGVRIDHRLRCVMTGGEVLSPQMEEWCIDSLCDSINPGFGQTEGNDLLGVVSGWERSTPGSIGRPLPGHEPIVLDPDGSEVPAGAEGELRFRVEGRPVFLLEYLKDPERTAETLRDGVLHTGDHVSVDERGYFHFVGRRDDVIKSSGYRIGPTEIENVIARHPAVIECAVIGLPDPERGQIVTAVLRLEDGADAETVFAELTERTRSEIGKHAYPRRFEVVDQFPKTVTGKIQRAQVRAALGLDAPEVERTDSRSG